MWPSVNEKNKEALRVERRGALHTTESNDTGRTTSSNTHDGVLEAGDVSNASGARFGLHRELGNRQIQLLAIGGSIGTALFVSIGPALVASGPGSLFLAYFVYSIMLGLINNCMAEMATEHPVAGGFVSMAGKWIDDAWGFMAGWNFFLYEALSIPFEITAINLVLQFWRNDIPAEAVCAACIVAYATLNIIAVKVYGEAEFWLSGGKIILILLLFSFTFVTMVGGNPKHDAYGFRYWNNPGAFAEFRTTGPLGRFEGFLAALWNASLTIVGPEYIAMVAAEAKRPRLYIKAAFKTVYWRFGIFFILGALCVGILVPYNDTTLVDVVSGKTAGAGTASASPYVIAMNNLGVSVLPQLVNALLLTSIFSAGNTYVYVATRTLYGLALQGRAPLFLQKCTRRGIPVYCYLVVLAFPFLSFLQVSNSTATVLKWLINIITAGGLINFITMGTTYIFFYRACVAQGVDRNNFSYTGWFQPWGAYISTIFLVMVLFCYGYTSFKPWSVELFFTYYTLLLFAPVSFTFWQLWNRTSVVKPHEADLVWERPLVDTHEASFVTPPLGFWKEMLQLIGIERQHKDVPSSDL